MTLPDSAQTGARALVDYAKSLDCIHCGLCLQTCPTYRLTGVEPSSPRGRIHLMRAVGEGRLAPDESYAEELDFCLLCRHCESVCPAGVRFGEMMEFARGHVTEHVARPWTTRFARWLGFRVLLPRRLALRLAGTALRALQVLRLDRRATRLGGGLGERAAALVDLPRIPPLSARRLLPARVSAQGEERERAALLEGCVMPELYARVNRATVDALRALDVALDIPRDATCCGSLHAHNGDLEGARKLARRMIQAFENAGDGPVVTNSAGCGAHMKECHQLFEEDDPWHGRAAAFAARVVDFTEFVAERRERLKLRAAARVPLPIAWDDPCHLCHAQGVRTQPRQVLDRLELEQVELTGSESCCGSAGIYSLLRPEASAEIFAEKRRALDASGAQTLVTANPGCQLQWESGLRRAGSDVRVVHLAELVADALR